MVPSTEVPNVTSSLSIGKGQRVIDIALDFPDYSHEEIATALEHAVNEGSAEKYEINRQDFYLKKA